MFQSRHQLYLRIGKRVLDLSLALVTCVMIAPIVVVVGSLVWVRLGSPILFLDRRPGFHGRPFTMFKFRTMTNDTDCQGALLPDEMRVTPFGQFLRSTSIDELPELINVLRGEMSLVGPRPLLIQYLSRYSPHQMRRHDVLPGITGWAQVHGRNALTWEKKFELDVWYVNHVSLALDVRILFLTVVTILAREGIRQPGFFSSEEFKGSDHQT